MQTRLRWVKPDLWAQPSHSLCLEYLWQVYKHHYQPDYLVIYIKELKNNSITIL